jgi:hypothetical protein
MNSPTRFAVLAFTGLSLLLGAGTARAAFLVNEIHLQYNVVDPTTGLPISTTGLKLVDLTGGHTTDPTPPLSGKFMSDASMNFGPVKLSPPNTTVDLRSLFVETNPKFHLTGFSSGEISTEVDFQFFDAFVASPLSAKMQGFEIDATVALNPADDGVTPTGVADFSQFYPGNGTVRFLFDSNFTLDTTADGTLSWNGPSGQVPQVTVIITAVPEPASVVTLLSGLGAIGAWVAGRRVRGHFRSRALTS